MFVLLCLVYFPQHNVSKFIHILLIYSSATGHLGCCHLLDNMNDAAMKFGVSV